MIKTIYVLKQITKINVDVNVNVHRNRNRIKNKLSGIFKHNYKWAL